MVTLRQKANPLAGNAGGLEAGSKQRRQLRIAPLEQHEFGIGHVTQDPRIKHIVIGMDLEQRLGAQQQRHGRRQVER